MPHPVTASGLTPKQELFCVEYLKDKNATQAAIRAGYSEDTARAIGCENLTKPLIQQRISVAMSESVERIMVDATWIRERLKKNVERSMEAEPVLDKEGNPIGVYKFHGQTANRALELLGKDLGMFSDKLEIKLGNESKELLQDLARLAIKCCAEDKKSELIDGLSQIETKYGGVGGTVK